MAHRWASINLRLQALTHENADTDTSRAKQNDDLPPRLDRRMRLHTVLICSLLPAYLNTNGGSIVRDLLADTGGHDASVGVFAILVTSRARILLNYTIQILLAAGFWWKSADTSAVHRQVSDGTTVAKGCVAAKVTSPDWASAVWWSIGVLALVDLCLPTLLNHSP